VLVVVSMICWQSLSKPVHCYDSIECGKLSLESKAIDAMCALSSIAKHSSMSDELDLAMKQLDEQLESTDVFDVELLPIAARPEEPEEEEEDQQQQEEEEAVEVEEQGDAVEEEKIDYHPTADLNDLEDFLDKVIQEKESKAPKLKKVFHARADRLCCFSRSFTITLTPQTHLLFIKTKRAFLLKIDIPIVLLSVKSATTKSPRRWSNAKAFRFGCASPAPSKPTISSPLLALSISTLWPLSPRSIRAPPRLSRRRPSGPAPSTCVICLSCLSCLRCPLRRRHRRRRSNLNQIRCRRRKTFHCPRRRRPGTFNRLRLVSMLQTLHHQPDCVPFVRNDLPNIEPPPSRAKTLCCAPSAPRRFETSRFRNQHRSAQAQACQFHRHPMRNLPQWPTPLPPARRRSSASTTKSVSDAIKIKRYSRRTWALVWSFCASCAWPTCESIDWRVRRKRRPASVNDVALPMQRVFNSDPMALRRMCAQHAQPRRHWL
jgi:hypothetical protein